MEPTVDKVRSDNRRLYVKVGKQWEERTNFTLRFLSHVHGTLGSSQTSGFLVEVTRAADGKVGCTLPYLTSCLVSSTMPFVWDDPSTADEVGQLSVDLGNGAVRGKSNEPPQVPKTACLVTANFDLSSVQRHYTRLCVLKMDVLKDKEPGDALKMEEMARKASSALPLVLHKLAQMDKDEVLQHTKDIMQHASAPMRVINGLSLAVVASKKVLEMTGLARYVGKVESYVNDDLIPYILKNTACEDITLQDVLKNLTRLTVEEVRSSMIISSTDVRVVRAVFSRKCHLTEDMTASLKQQGGRLNIAGRIRGQVVKTVILPIHLFSEEAMTFLHNALNQEQEAMETYGPADDTDVDMHSDTGDDENVEDDINIEGDENIGGGNIEGDEHVEGDENIDGDVHSDLNVDGDVNVEGDVNIVNVNTVGDVNMAGGVENREDEGNQQESDSQPADEPDVQQVVSSASKTTKVRRPQRKCRQTKSKTKFNR